MEQEQKEEKKEKEDVPYESPIWWKDLMKEYYGYELKSESK